MCPPSRKPKAGCFGYKKVDPIGYGQFLKYKLLNLYWYIQWLYCITHLYQITHINICIVFIHIMNWAAYQSLLQKIFLWNSFLPLVVLEEAIVIAIVCLTVWHLCLSVGWSMFFHRLWIRKLLIVKNKIFEQTFVTKICIMCYRNCKS